MKLVVSVGSYERILYGLDVEIKVMVESGSLSL